MVRLVMVQSRMAGGPDRRACVQLPGARGGSRALGDRLCAVRDSDMFLCQYDHGPLGARAQREIADVHEADIAPELAAIAATATWPPPASAAAARPHGSAADDRRRLREVPGQRLSGPRTVSVSTSRPFVGSSSRQ